jgi:hypothetical protein
MARGSGSSRTNLGQYSISMFLEEGRGERQRLVHV